MLRETAQQLLNLLSRWDRRQRVQQSLIWLPRGLMAGIAAGIALAVVARLQPLLMPEQIALIGGVGLVLGGLIALAIIWLRQHDAVALARHFDDLFDLKERISTALEMTTGRIQSPNAEITNRQVDDALTRAQRIDARSYLPLRIRWRDVAILAAAIVAFVLLLVLENPQSETLAQQQSIQNTIQQQVEDLENLREQLADAEQLDESTREDLLAALDEALEELDRDDLSPEEAFATMSELAEEMQDIAEAQDAASPEQQQAIQDAAQQLQEQASDVAEAMEQGDLSGAADALESLGDSLGEMERTAQQDLSQALQNAADQLGEESGDLADSLEDAAEALEQGDIEAAEQALDRAAEAMDQQAQQTGGTNPDNTARQIASQASQQVEEGARQVAQSGSSQPSEQQQSAGQSDQTGQQGGGEGDPERIQQAQGQGDENTQGQINQPGAGDGTESGEPGSEGQGSAGDESSESQASSAADGGGAGEGESTGQEGGFAAGDQQIGQGNEPDGSGLTDFEPVFAPQTIGGDNGQQIQVGGDGDPGDVVVQEGNLAESPEGESIVGYDEVFSDYANAANEALERDYIPLSLRDVIHDYFSSLEP
jgi:tetratricopeptide (TPR) repeat protein